MYTVNYFDIFPNAKFSVSPKPSDEIKEEVCPSHVSDLVKSLLSSDSPNNIFKIEHQALCKHAFLLIFDGLDNSRWNKFREILPSFSSISDSGFPVTVLAKVNKNLIIPATQTLLERSPCKQRHKFKSYDEMLTSLFERVNNGYPIKPGTEIPEFQQPKRFSYFHMREIPEEEIANEFRELPEKVENSRDVIGIDCEMIKTSKGEEVARLSVVDKNGELVLDEFFKPLGEVEDYRTKFSGITEELVMNREYTSDKSVDILAKVADSHTIIVGHSLENDLRALKVIHDKVIDTALIYNADSKYPSKPPLAKLYSKYIKKPFRTEQMGGHDSIEDAKASIELANYAMKSPVSEVRKGPEFPKFLETLTAFVSKMNLIGPGFFINFPVNNKNVNAIIKDSNEELGKSLIETLDGEVPPLTIAYFYSLSRCVLTDEEETKAAKEYNDILSQVLEKIPKQSALIVYTANGNLKRLRTENGHKGYIDETRTVEFTLCRQGLLWVKCYEP